MFNVLSSRAFQREVRRNNPGGVMTLHDCGYLPPGFLKSYPVSE